MRGGSGVLESLNGRHVTVQGVGHVGYHLVRHLAQEGAKITVTDIDAEKIETVVKEFGVEVCGLDDIYDIDCDIYAPCALGGTINDDTIKRIRCQLIAGSANNVLGDEEKHGRQLRELGILYCPDYVINAGLDQRRQRARGYNQQRAAAGGPDSRHHRSDLRLLGRKEHPDLPRCERAR